MANASEIAAALAALRVESQTPEERKAIAKKAAAARWAGHEKKGTVKAQSRRRNRAKSS